ncbi:MAG: glycosyltransferase family 47 protein [Verrucomicrobiota bacterium]|nr:glycosyltransferase family 47 protein [Verrucomicrobiota bacterium]
MAKVLLLTTTPRPGADPHNLAAWQGLRESAERDRFLQHSLTDDPAQADVILFAEAMGAGFYFSRVRTHEFVHRFREKCFLFSSNDYIIPFLPGVYAAAEKRWSSARVRGGFYAGFQTNAFLEFTRPTPELKYLFSFVGSTETAAVRRNLARLVHARSIFTDTAADYQRVLRSAMPADERAGYERRYAEIMQQSKFILCPRGMGASSMRLFDVMRIGRVPVVLSDRWLPPVGPRWEEFALRVPEADWEKLPRLLESREAQAVEMGLLARQEWENWFAPPSAFHRTVEWCLELRRQRRVPEAIARLPAFLQFLRPFHLRQLLRLARKEK